MLELDCSRVRRRLSGIFEDGTRTVEDPQAGFEEKQLRRSISGASISSSGGGVEDLTSSSTMMMIGESRTGGKSF